MASGNKFEPKNYLNVTDADNKLEYSFEGELNTDKVGEYPIESPHFVFLNDKFFLFSTTIIVEIVDLLLDESLTVISIGYSPTL